MSLYGDFDQQFRPRPSAAALLSVSTASLILSAALVSLLQAALQLALAAGAGVRSPLAIYAPFPPATTFIYGGLARGLLPLTPIILSAAALLFSLLVARFWPTDPRLSTRLSVLTLALSASAFGSLSVAFQPRLFAGLSILPPVAWAVLSGAVAAWAILLSERAMVDLMGTMFPAESPAVRFRLWLLRLPAGLILLSILAWMEGRSGTALAGLATVVITLLENISRRPRRYFEDVREAPMKEAALALPLVALIIAGTMIWAFGLRTAGRPPRAATLKGGTLFFIPLAAQNLASKIVMQAEPKKPEPKPRIRARWSKDRGKDGVEIVVP